MTPPPRRRLASICGHLAASAEPLRGGALLAARGSAAETTLPRGPAPLYVQGVPNVLTEEQKCAPYRLAEARAQPGALRSLLFRCPLRALPLAAPLCSVLPAPRRF